MGASRQRRATTPREHGRLDARRETAAHAAKKVPTMKDHGCEPRDLNRIVDARDRPRGPNFRRCGQGSQPAFVVNKGLFHRPLLARHTNPIARPRWMRPGLPTGTRQPSAQDDQSRQQASVGRTRRARPRQTSTVLRARGRLPTGHSQLMNAPAAVSSCSRGTRASIAR